MVPAPACKWLLSYIHQNEHVHFAKFYGDLMGFSGDLIGFYGDLMGYEWVLPSSKLT